MTIYLNKELADTICALITAGFIQKETTKSKEFKTCFIYENPKEKDKHDKISDNLKKFFNVNVSFQQQKDKIAQPFIIAHTKKFVEETADLIENVYTYRAQILDILADHTDKLPFYGAYISGCITSDKVIFSGTSGLKLYPRPKDWTIDGLDNSIVETSFLNAKKTTDEINNFLKKNLTKENSTQKIHFDLSGEITTTPDDFIKDSLFGSIHGLVYAIIKYNLNENGILSDTLATCCELALSKDTSKVASCIPCSIFASSNKTPATCTHLGRGDNWNFPDVKNSDIKKALWIAYVDECFNIGYKQLGDNINKLKQISEVNTLNPQLKAEIFLHSLAFEGKFADRLNTAFDLMNK